MYDPDRELRWLVAAIAGITALRWALASQLGLLADEAWYWVWSHDLALGYWDQPPAIAWTLAAERALFGDGPWALRLVPVACGAIVAAAPIAAARSRSLWVGWSLSIPALAGLTLFATPDALLLGAWAIGLAAAIRGGRWWLLAGVAAGCAFEAKHTGALLLPLCVAACPQDTRERWPWLGGVVALAIAAPNLAWNATHDWVTVRFQFHEGLAHPHAPGWTGPPFHVVDQLGVVSPVAGAVGYAWAALGGGLRADDRAVRVAWWTSAPLLAGFAVAAAFAPAEAHWPAPAWLGLGLGLSHASARWRAAAWSGVGIAMVVQVLLAVHLVHPIARVPWDPGTRLTEGATLGPVVARLATDGQRVVTERYQEAALVQYTTGIDARVLPGCGRPGQQDLEAPPAPGPALFLRPATSGPLTCVGPEWVVRRGPIAIHAADSLGRPVGPWQVFELEAAP